MRKSSLALLAGLGVTLSACATTGPATAPDPLGLLRLALDASPDVLKQAAAKDDRKAEYALAIIYTYGLNGAPIDVPQAVDLRTRAQRAIYTPITQYIPGLDGKPGRTNIINMSTPGVDPFVARASDDCALALHGGGSTEPLCNALMPQWQKATGH